LLRFIGSHLIAYSTLFIYNDLFLSISLLMTWWRIPGACQPPARNASQCEAGGSQAAQALPAEGQAGRHQILLTAAWCKRFHNGELHVKQFL
jgi:hypothetical protein